MKYLLFLLPILAWCADVEVIEAKDFEKVVLDSKKPVVVDFFANWCYPCRKMKPIVQQMAKQFDGKVKFVMINVDRSKELRQEYKIQKIPTFYFVENGKVIEHRTGSLSEAAFSDKIKENFKL